MWWQLSPSFNNRKNEQVEEIASANICWFFKNFGGKEEQMRKVESGG